MTDLRHAIAQLQAFAGQSLTSRIASLEIALEGANTEQASRLLERESVNREILGSAYLVKRVAGEINVVIHALGILFLIPLVLEPGEKIDYLSLGAGNTGRPFDLETDRRIAEFKFSRWQGGADTIRQNSMFKDFFQLAEYNTTKKRFLYVLDRDLQLRFLHGRRALDSVLSKNMKVRDEFRSLYGDRFATVRDYYLFRRDTVEISDVGPLLEELAPAGEILTDAIENQSEPT
jgi:hypothetical protein